MKRLIATMLFFIGPTVIAAPATKVAVGELELELCHIKGYQQEVLCGEYSVYEDRAAQQGRKIDIVFAVVPAIAAEKLADPLVFLAGGPGQGARDMGPFIPLALQEIHETRDIILIDQRGMGSSHPLNCEQDDEFSLLLGDAELARLSRENLQQCLLELDADVTKYTQDLANEDIHDILLALGYDRVNLYGVSWGTRSALLYTHQFPEHVRSVILDGNAPLENKVSLYANADAERALQALFKDCENDLDCQASFPALEQDFNEVLDAFGENGYEVTLNDATSGEVISFVLTRNTFVNAIRAILYVPQISRLIPIIIDQAKLKDFRALMGVVAVFDGDLGIATGTQLTILCAEDYARMSNQEIASETSKGFVGDAFVNFFANACSVWPRAPLPEIYSRDLSSQVPALILSGAIDPVTPERWGNKMAELMTNSIHLIAANTGHNVAPNGCAPELMAQFVNQASVEGIDGSCLDELSRPSFFVDANGPTPAPESTVELQE